MSALLVLGRERLLHRLKAREADHAPERMDEALKVPSASVFPREVQPSPSCWCGSSLSSVSSGHGKWSSFGEDLRECERAGAYGPKWRLVDNDLDKGLLANIFRNGPLLSIMLSVDGSIWPCQVYMHQAARHGQWAMQAFLVPLFLRS